MKITFLITAFLIATSSFAQEESTLSENIKLKFGKVSDEELLLKECPFYPEADAMILAEWGQLGFTYNNEKGWQYQMEVTTRIKIFNKSGKDYGNVRLRLYQPVVGTSREEISSIKGYTYNLVEGKVEKTKLKNSDEFETRINDYRIEKSFAMPDVQDGSVIEYNYRIVSDFISTLRTWHFQNEIPTAVSEISFTIPEFFQYNVNQVGAVVPLEWQENNRQEEFTYKYENIGPGGEVQRGTGSVSSLSKQQMVLAKNILPVEEEPFMNNKPNIPARIEYQLMTIKMPNSPLKMMAGSYEKFNDDMLTRSNFGDRLSKGNFAKEQLANLSTASELEKAAAIYSWLRGHFTWNEYYGFTSSDAGKTAYNRGNGSVADINLTLVAALREAGLEAYPVVMSTRGNGIPHPVYPNYESFNYVIAAVSIEGTLYLCDATSKRPFGKLPVRCLNGNGWMTSEHGGKWINLKSNATHSSVLLTTIKIEDDMLKAHVEAKFKEHAATEQRYEMSDEGEAEYKAEFAETFPEWDLTNFSSHDTTTAFNLKFDLEKSFDGEDILYLQPILYGGIKENMFKREERFSPVDFPYAVDKKIMVSIEVPEGYTSELPEPVYVKLPDNGGKFIYQVSQLGNTINIMCNIDLQKLDFTPAEYPYIKQFYQTIADRNNEMIVLKKM